MIQFKELQSRYYFKTFIIFVKAILSHLYRINLYNKYYKFAIKDGNSLKCFLKRTESLKKS